jgi:Flp pilus assembly protein TadG
MQRRFQHPTQHIETSRVRRLPGLRIRAGEQGQATVEFALLLPVLLLVLFGIVQFALALNAANDQTHIANEVARFAIVNENPAGKAETLARWGKKQAYTNYTTALNNEGKVCIRFPTKKAEIGEPVEVEVTSTTNWIPILNTGATSTTIKGTAVMRLEAPPTTYGEECA